MFKKTLIAAAIATVSASAVMADVSISGQVKVAVTDTDASDAAYTGTAVTVSDYAPSFDNSLTFKASDDLGNGMSAFAVLALDVDEFASDDGTDNNEAKDMLAGVKGSFGTIVAGRMELLTTSKVLSVMDMGAGTGGIESGNTIQGRANAMAYISPTVNGVHVAVAGTMSAAADTFENTNIAVFYDNGPLSIKVVSEDAVAANSDALVAAVTYSMGDLKVAYAMSDSDTAAEGTDNMYRLDYGMGNNVVTVGHLDDDTAGTANNDVTEVKLTHKLSKKTAVWAGVRDKKSGADQTHFGIITKF